ncbi:hypothetical protein CK203_054713 [Vitis vinifera]|uniref:Uncharacterized protein n=1 Tax=Vitis vinifera TaxID=29760 RepID=A0A438H178_VITVI|nr:hypothetical protein CK203_054713 [Vitis vinifera]
MFDEAWDSLEKAVRRMKKYADRDRRPLEFQVGGRVLLKLTSQIWKKISSKTRQRGLIPKYDGPFEDLDAERVQTKRAPPLVMKQFDREIEKILDHRTMGHNIKNRPGEIGLMGRPCTHESLGGKQGKPGGLAVQTLGAKCGDLRGQAPDVRYPERGNKGFPSGWNEGFPSGWNEGFPSGCNEGFPIPGGIRDSRPGGMSYDSRSGGMSDAMR